MTTHVDRNGTHGRLGAVMLASLLVYSVAYPFAACDSSCRRCSLLVTVGSKTKSREADDGDMVAHRVVAASSSESGSAVSSHDESDFDSGSESLSDDSAYPQALGSRIVVDAKSRPLATFKNPTGSSGSQWSSREKQFEAFRAGLVTLPLPDGVQRIEKARGYSLHIMSVLNWVLPETILSLHSTANQLQHDDDDDASDSADDLVLTLGAHVSMFHAPSRRFFGNTWVSPELPVDPIQIKQRQTTKNSSVSYVVENALLNFRAYFLSDVVDANCVGIVELVAYQKDPDSKATVKVTGCGWTIVPLFSRAEKGSASAPPSAFSMEVSGQSVNVFVGSPRVLWEVAPSAWNSQETLENCKLFYQLVQYEPILLISMFLRRNELVGALDTIPGLKNGNLANIDVGRNPKMLLWEEQDATYEEALATFVKLASLVPKSIAVEEAFELAVTASRVAIHLRQKVESDVIARLKISRKAIHDGASSIEGEISARVLKIALHNGRCFRTRQHTVPLKENQAGDDMLRCVSNRTRLKGFVFHPFLAIVVVLQFTVHFRLEWPSKLKQAAVDAKRPLPPEEDVVLVTIGSRAIVPSDGKKLYLYDKHHHATAVSTQPMVMGGDDDTLPVEDAVAKRVLHVDLLSGAPCRPYSDNTLYTPLSHAPLMFQAGAALNDASISYCDIKIEPGEYQGSAAADAAAGTPAESGNGAGAEALEDAAGSNNQLSDKEGNAKQTEGHAAERWAKKLLDKAGNNTLLAQVLDTLADSPSEAQQSPASPVVKPIGENKLSPTKQAILEPISLPTNCRSSELSRASKTLLARHGYMDGIDGREIPSSSSNQVVAVGRGRTKTPVSMRAKTLEQELSDVYKANEIRFHFAALRTFIYINGGETATTFAASRVYFTFQFYKFAPTRTEPLRLNDAFDNGSGGESKTLLLMREKPADKPSLAIQFEVDTSATMNPLESKQFAEYLLTKSLYVDVWDADSLFLLGTFAIPLHELLRQGAGVKKFQAEIDIFEPVDIEDERFDQTTNDEDVATSRTLDAGEGFDPRNKVVVAKIQLLMSNYGLKGENRLANINADSNQESMVSASKSLGTGTSLTSTKHRVRARPLVESNPELRRLLSQEGFYQTPTGRVGDEERSKRCHHVDGTTDAATLSAKEISILCDLFRSRKPSLSGQSSSRILCDRDGQTGLVALFSLHPKAAAASSSSEPSGVKAMPLSEKSEQIIAPKAEEAVALDAKQRMNADLLQRIITTASKHNVALEDAFREFDKNGDGFLSHAEFVSALRSLGDVFEDASDEELVALAANMDTNKDGRVDCTEFGAFLTRSQTSQERSEAWRDRIKRVISRASEKGVHVHQVFVQLDSSGDGKLSLGEFESALKQLGITVEVEHEVLRRLLDEFDTDHDGQISYHEFIQSLGISIEQNRAEVIIDTTEDIVARVREVVKRLEARGVNLGDVFVHFDKDKNGSLSLPEFMEAMNQLLASDVAGSEADGNSNTLKSLEREAAIRILKSVNADEDDKIDYREFLSFCGVSHSDLRRKEEELRQANLARAEKKLVQLILRACASDMKVSDIFKHFDTDADGVISTSEFQRSFEQLFRGQELDADGATQIAARFDRNGDGKISIQEFQDFTDEIVRNQHALLALLMPHVDTLDITVRDSSGGLLEEQQWKSLCHDKLKLTPEQAIAVYELIGYFSLVDDSGRINLTELVTLLKMVASSASSVATSAMSTTTDAPPADPPTERLRKLLTRARDQGVDLKTSFGHFDADGSGEVTREELRSGLRALGIFDDMNETELDTLLDQLDADASGKISFREFSALVQVDETAVASKDERNNASSRDEVVAQLRILMAKAADQGVSMESCFGHFDKNQDGKISSKEFVEAMIELGLATRDQDTLLLEVAKQLDRNGSGDVDLTEFKLLFPTSSSETPLNPSVSALAVEEKEESRCQEHQEDSSNASAMPSNTSDGPVSAISEPANRLRSLLLVAKASGVDVQTSFAHLDTDGSGTVTCEAFVASLRQLVDFEVVPEEEIRGAVVTALDSNGSGSISLSEFQAFLSSMSDATAGSLVEVQESPSLDASISAPEQAEGVGSKPNHTTAAGSDDASILAAEASEDPTVTAASDSVQAETGVKSANLEGNPPATEPGTSHSPEASEAALVAEKPKDDVAGDGEEASANVDKTDGVHPSETERVKSSTRAGKTKPPIARASSFAGAGRGKSRGGARPSLAATRRARTDPESIQAMAGGSKTAEIAIGQAGAQGGASAACAKTERRPSFAAARASAAKKAATVGTTATASEENGTSSVQLAAAPPSVAMASTAPAPAEVLSSVERLRALLVAAQTTGVDVRKSFEHFDKARRGRLTYDEFARGLRELGEEFGSLSDEQMTQVALVLDRDKRGDICVDDLSALVATDTTLGRPQASAATESSTTATLKDESHGESAAESTQAPAPATPQLEAKTRTATGLAPADDCAYAFSADPEVRAVELKLRRAAVDAYARGVLPLRLLSKFLDERDSAVKGKAKAARRRSELLRVEFLQVLMELGFHLEATQLDGQHPGAGGCATRMNDVLYARQLARLASYRRHTTARADSRAQRQLVRAAARRQPAGSRADAASVARFDEAKQQALRVLAYYRDGQKKGLVYALLREQVSTALSLFPSFAQPLFLELPVRNPYNRSERFRVELLLPANVSRLVDLAVVRCSREWSFYRRHVPLAFPINGDKCDGFGGDGDGDSEIAAYPVEREMIDGKNELVMDAHDAVRIPMRLRWLDASAVPFSSARRGGADTDADTDADEKAMAVSVLITSCSLGHTIALFKLSLRPQAPQIHRVLRFSQPESSIWRWRPRCPDGAVLTCLDPRVAIEEVADTDGRGRGVTLKCRVGAYPALEQFHVVLYGDRFLATALETWQVRVQARMRVDALAVIGQRATTELVVRAPPATESSRRLVQCFARAPARDGHGGADGDCSTAQFRPSGAFPLAPGAFNRVEMAYCSVCDPDAAPATRQVLVNLVDVARRELVGAWSVLVALRPPRVTKTFALEVPAAAGAHKKIAYANPWDVEQVVVLRSSAAARLAPRERELRVPAGGRVFLRLAFLPVDTPGGEAVLLLFINDKPTDASEECLRFHVRYV